MKLTELIGRANRGYEADVVLTTLTGFYDMETGEPLAAPSGDGLAGFIVTELAETFDDTATDEEELTEAVRVIERARTDFDNIIAALEETL